MTAADPLVEASETPIAIVYYVTLDDRPDRTDRGVMYDLGGGRFLVRWLTGDVDEGERESGRWSLDVGGYVRIDRREPDRVAGMDRRCRAAVETACAGMASDLSWEDIEALIAEAARTGVVPLMAGERP